jgi:hypothetical protein
VGAEGKDVHGDVGESEKNRIRGHYPDILLTTPESLEVMLISARPEAREMLKGVRLVIIDEIHALRSRQGPISGGSLEVTGLPLSGPISAPQSASKTYLTLKSGRNCERWSNLAAAFRRRCQLPRVCRRTPFTFLRCFPGSHPRLHGSAKLYLGYSGLS